MGSFSAHNEDQTEFVHTEPIQPSNGAESQGTLPNSPDVSMFCSDDFISRIQQDMAVKLWESLRDKIRRTPPHLLLNLESEAEKIWDTIAKNSIDCSIVRVRVNQLFQKVRDLTSTQEEFGKKVDLGTHNQQITEAKSSLEALKSKNGLTIRDNDSIQQKIDQSRVREDNLAEALELARKETASLEASKKEIQLQLQAEEAALAKANEELIALETTPVLAKDESEILKTLRDSVDNAYKELKSFIWKM